MDRIEVTDYEAVAVRGQLDVATGRVEEERRGDWRVGADGYFLRVGPITASVYRAGPKVWWQVGPDKIELSDAVRAELKPTGRKRRQRWELVVADDICRLRFEYPCPSLQEFTATDPTFDVDQYIDFNIGVLVLKLVRDRELRGMWLTANRQA